MAGLLTVSEAVTNQPCFFCCFSQGSALLIVKFGWALSSTPPVILLLPTMSGQVQQRPDTETIAEGCDVSHSERQGKRLMNIAEAF